MHASHLGRPVQNYRNSPGKRFQNQVPETRAGRASVLRTVNFKRLAAAVGGPEELGALLDMTVGRLKALEEGQDFSDETAFHLETELNLPSGWFDQKDPPVPSNIGRTEEADEKNTTKELEVFKEVVQNKDMANAQSSETTSKARESQLAKEPAAQQAPESASSQASGVTTVTLEVAPMSTSSVADPVQAARGMRRSNLTVLTSWPKSKSGLARLLGKTPANVSHLIHGEKNFDRDAALEIERATGLPENWFETARAASEVPSQVVSRLTSKPGSETPATNEAGSEETAPRKRGRPRKNPEAVTATPTPVAKASTPAEGAEVSAPRKRGRPRKNPEAAIASTSVASPPASVSAGPTDQAPRKRGRPRKNPETTAAPAASPEPAAVASYSDTSMSTEPRKRGRPRKNPLPEGASAVTGVATTAVSPPADNAVALPVGPVMSEPTRRKLRESEGLMGPIAEALVKTIIDKSRTGALSEKAAYKMLSEVMDR